ncbi:response regulator transcription factor [Leucobacter insecticola]|uniref:Response regulator transcription factor n=1 Tax=Leucobacter insecticola TaxID=2714934 RepID=A0A6G8FLG7_9MICO|nr:response regulator transcription factor [Leucobacter insecticola]QIM17330.1 response regulator transcription factor [Leucobacter insecticola]
MKGGAGAAAGAGASPIRVVIVDDHQIFRTGLRAELGPELEVVGEAATVDEAIAAIPTLQPDVVLLDVHLPGGAGGGGAEVLRETAARPDMTRTQFLALSVSDAADDVVSVIRAGARGYLTKTSSGAEVTAAVLRVHGGDAVFSSRLAGFVLDAFGAGTGETAAADDELDRLSAREQEVMRMIARGYAYKEVAAELFLSVKTVETHVSNVLRKLQLSNRHELTAWALSRRLL